MSGSVVLLAGDDPMAWIVYHALARQWPDLTMIVEDGVPRRAMLRRRARMLGVRTVAGQVLFVAGVVPVLRRLAAGRIAEIKRTHGLDDSPVERSVVRVASVNAEETREALRRLRPGVVVVCGTRIIGRRTLGAVAAPFVNIHAGITPRYRGGHGGYWALAEGRPDLAGTTIHLVDEGIDTGAVLARATFPVTPDDCFVTYPYLHVAAGLPPLVEATRHALAGTLTPSADAGPGPSAARSHPTLWGYARTRLTKGIR